MRKLLGLMTVLATGAIISTGCSTSNSDTTTESTNQISNAGIISQSSIPTYRVDVNDLKDFKLLDIAKVDKDSVHLYWNSNKTKNLMLLDVTNPKASNVKKLCFAKNIKFINGSIYTIEDDNTAAYVAVYELQKEDKINLKNSKLSDKTNSSYEGGKYTFEDDGIYVAKFNHDSNNVVSLRINQDSNKTSTFNLANISSAKWDDYHTLTLNEKAIAVNMQVTLVEDSNIDNDNTDSNVGFRLETTGGSKLTVEYIDGTTAGDHASLDVYLVYNQIEEMDPKKIYNGQVKGHALVGLKLAVDSNGGGIDKYKYTIVALNYNLAGQIDTNVGSITLETDKTKKDHSARLLSGKNPKYVTFAYESNSYYLYKVDFTANTLSIDKLQDTNDNDVKVPNVNILDQKDHVLTVVDGTNNKFYICNLNNNRCWDREDEIVGNGNAGNVQNPLKILKVDDSNVYIGFYYVNGANKKLYVVKYDFNNSPIVADIRLQNINSIELVKTADDNPDVMVVRVVADDNNDGTDETYYFLVDLRFGNPSIEKIQIPEDSTLTIEKLKSNGISIFNYSKNGQSFICFGNLLISSTFDCDINAKLLNYNFDITAEKSVMLLYDSDKLYYKACCYDCIGSSDESNCDIISSYFFEGKETVRIGNRKFLSYTVNNRESYTEAYIYKLTTNDTDLTIKEDYRIFQNITGHKFETAIPLDLNLEDTLIKLKNAPYYYLLKERNN